MCIIERHIYLFCDVPKPCSQSCWTPQKWGSLQEIGHALHRLSTVLPISVCLVFQKDSNLPLIVGCTKYHSCIALSAGGTVNSVTFRTRSNLFSTPVMTTFAHGFCPIFSYLHNWPFLGTQPSYSSLLSHWFTLVLREIQWDVMHWPPFCLWIIPCFPQATCSACCLLHAGFSLCIFFIHKVGGDMALSNINWLSPDRMMLHATSYNIL